MIASDLLLREHYSYLIPKGPTSQNGFLGSSGRLSWRQKHERSTEILEEGRRMYLRGEKKFNLEL
jgi:hypothetical protein